MKVLDGQSNELYSSRKRCYPRSWLCVKKPTDAGMLGVVADGKPMDGGVKLAGWLSVINLRFGSLLIIP